MQGSREAGEMLGEGPGHEASAVIADRNGGGSFEDAQDLFRERGVAFGEMHGNIPGFEAFFCRFELVHSGAGANIIAGNEGHGSPGGGEVGGLAAGEGFDDASGIEGGGEYADHHGGEQSRFAEGGDGVTGESASLGSFFRGHKPWGAGLAVFDMVFIGKFASGGNIGRDTDGGAPLMAGMDGPVRRKNQRGGARVFEAINFFRNRMKQMFIHGDAVDPPAGGLVFAVEPFGRGQDENTVIRNMAQGDKVIGDREGFG